MRTRLSLAAAMLAAWAGVAPAWPNPFHPRHPVLARMVTTLGDWRLEIARDRFSGDIACLLAARDHRAVYSAGAVAFRFRARWDVEAAVYRIDGGTPRAMRDDLPALADLGAPVDRGTMESPTGGWVWVPWARLAEAHAIAIEPRRGHAPVTFRLRGLWPLLEIAHGRGCTPDSRFVAP